MMFECPGQFGKALELLKLRLTCREQWTNFLCHDLS